MIRKLWIESFKAFPAAPEGKWPPGIPLQPFTVLVGPNGAGKSTILQAIDTLGWLSNGTLQQMLDAHRWEYADFAHMRAPSGQSSLSAEIELPGGVSVDWSLRLGSRRAPGIVAEFVDRDDESGFLSLVTRRGRSVQQAPERGGGALLETTLSLPASWLSTIDLRKDRDRHPTLVALAQWARHIRAYYFLDPVELRAPSRGKDEKFDELGLHGGNLATFLGRIQKSRPRDFANLIRRVRAHYPPLVDIHVRRKSYGWAHIEITEKWNGEQATFNARQVSDGLLRLIAVAAMHEMREAPSVLLLDEIENGLHPRLLGGLVGMLEELTRGGATQVVATTHSPITLNYVSSPESVLLVTRGKGGGVKVTPMSEAKGFTELREHFELGELWYNAGEERLVPKGRGR